MHFITCGQEHDYKQKNPQVVFTKIVHKPVDNVDNF